MVSEQTNNVLFLSFGDKLSQMFVALLKAHLGPTHGMVFQSIWLPKKFGPNAEFGHFLCRRAVNVITIVSQISACKPSSFQVVEIENPNMDCLCPEQFKEENEASNDPKFTILKTEKSILTGIILHKR